MRTNISTYIMNHSLAVVDRVGTSMFYTNNIVLINYQWWSTHMTLLLNRLYKFFLKLGKLCFLKVWQIPLRYQFYVNIPKKYIFLKLRVTRLVNVSLSHMLQFESHLYLILIYYITTTKIFKTLQDQMLLKSNKTYKKRKFLKKTSIKLTHSLKIAKKRFNYFLKRKRLVRRRKIRRWHRRLTKGILKKIYTWSYKTW